MSGKAPLIAALLAVTAFAGTAALAQDDATEEPSAALMEQFERMRGVTEDFEAATDMAERHALMRQHMALMQEMGTGMMGGRGGMHHGDGESADMARMQSQMMAMRQMMTAMMAQQNLMMQMQDDEDDAEE